MQRLFHFVWYGTNYKVDAEANNGRGQVDFIVSMGQENQNIIEFKLASNSTLAHVFTQVKIYEAANCAKGSLIAIFCFSEREYLYAERVVKEAGYEEMIGESIYLLTVEMIITFSINSINKRHTQISNDVYVSGVVHNSQFISY